MEEQLQFDEEHSLFTDAFGAGTDIDVFCIVTVSDSDDSCCSC